MTDLLMEWFREFSVILNNLGPTGTLIALLVFVVWNQNRGTERDDKFRNDLLTLHAKAVEGVEKSTENTGNITALLERHERSAQERADAQFIRDDQRLKTLARIAEYLTVLDKTSDTVDNIETTATRIQGNIANMQTDIPSLIERKHDETKKDLASIKDVMSKNYDLVEQTLSKLKDQNEQVLKQMKDDSTSVELRQILTTQTATLGIVRTVVTNNHKLLETLTARPEPVEQLAASPEAVETSDKIEESDEEDEGKHHEESEQSEI